MGLNFGLYDTTLNSRLHSSSYLATVWFSDTSLELKAPAGIQRSNSMMVTVSRKVGTATEVFSYNPARFATTGLSNAPPKALLPGEVAARRSAPSSCLGMAGTTMPTASRLLSEARLPPSRCGDRSLPSTRGPYLVPLAHLKSC